MADVPIYLGYKVAERPGSLLQSQLNWGTIMRGITNDHSFRRKAAPEIPSRLPGCFQPANHDVSSHVAIEEKTPRFSCLCKLQEKEESRERCSSSLTEIPWLTNDV